MEIRRLPADEAAVRRFVEVLWLPYTRELERIVEGFSLADDVDLVTEELGHRLERHDTESYRAWVAIDGAHDGDDLAEISADFAGFVTTDVDESPPVFDRPDRIVICDIFVEEPYRGTGLSRELVEVATERARERGCAELKLEVDAENERARAFYESLGFEPTRHTMTASVAGN